MVRNRCISHPKNKGENVSAELSIVILAAGSYRNFKRSVSIIQLADGTTIVQKQVEALKKAYPLADITVVVGHDSDSVIDYLSNNMPDIRIIHNERFSDTNNSRSLNLAIMAGQKNNLLVINGDILFDYDYIKNAVGLNSCLLIDKTKQITDDEVGVISHEGILTSISHGLPNIWSQILFVTGNELSLIKSAISNKKNHMKYLYEIINSVIDEGGVFATQNQSIGYIKELDNFKDLEKVNENLM